MPLFVPPLGIPEMLALGVRLWYRSAVLALSPVGYWRLGEASGSTAVDEVGANNGTYVNTPTLGVTGALTGDPNTAITFAIASSERVVINAAALHPGDTFSIVAWIKRTAAGNTDVIWENLAVGDIKVWVFSDNRLYLSQNFVGNPYSSTATITDTNWHMVAICKNGAALAGYIDGVASANLSGGGTITADTGVDSFIGGNGGAFDGSADEVGFWNRALSDAEIAALYRIGSGT